MNIKKNSDYYNHEHLGAFQRYVGPAAIAWKLTEQMWVTELFYKTTTSCPGLPDFTTTRN